MCNNEVTNVQQPEVQKSEPKKKFHKSKVMRFLVSAFSLFSMLAFACAEDTASSGTTMDGFLANATSFLTWMLSSVVSVIKTAMGEPILLFGMLCTVVFMVIVFYKKIKHS